VEKKFPNSPFTALIAEFQKKKIMTENKKIEIGENFTKYEDASFDVKCSVCGKEEHLEPDSKMAIRYSQISGSISEHTCLECWKKGKDDAKQDQIAMGQARNLAQADVHSLGLKITDGDKYWKALDKYQIEHYKKLKGRRNSEKNES